LAHLAIIGFLFGGRDESMKSELHDRHLTAFAVRARTGRDILGSLVQEEERERELVNDITAALKASRVVARFSNRDNRDYRRTVRFGARLIERRFQRCIASRGESWE